MLLPCCQAPDLTPGGDQFALALAAGHDLDGDRIPDLAIADSTPFDRVEVWFVSGRDGSVLDRWVDRDSGGWADVDFLGDIDCDGCSEIAVSVMPHRGSGRVEILSGRDRSVIRTLHCPDLGLRSHCSADAAGDVDWDGSGDWIVRGTEEVPANRTQASVVVLSGRSGSVIWRAVNAPLTVAVWPSSARAGDVDADGRDDVLFCWQREDLRIDRVVVHSGRTGRLLLEIPGPEAELDFGCSLDGGFDFDLDSRPDILVASPHFGSSEQASARVRVYSGRNGSLLQLLDGIDFPRVDVCGTDQFGECARFVPDVDGDRVPEILVGSPEEGWIEGSAYLCSGRTGTILRAVEGKLACTTGKACEEDDYHTGRLVAATGDLDLDGTPDFVVGNVPYDRGQWGRVRAYSGRTGEVLLELDRKRLLQEERLGRSIPP